MSKTICLVAVLVLAMIINVSAGSVSLTQYNDAGCTSAAQSGSINTNQCLNFNGAMVKASCNSTVSTIVLYSDGNCQNAVGSSVYPAGQCVAKVIATCNSSAWMFAPSLLLIAAIAALTSFGVKRF